VCTFSCRQEVAVRNGGATGSVMRSVDSPLEKDGFENSVPRQIGSGFKASVGLGPIDVGAAESSGRSSGSATDRAVSAAQGAAPTAEMKTPTLLAVARHRGTDSISLQRRV